MADPITALRAFNRSYTQRIGVLDESFLGSGRPLGPNRVLYEIGPQGCTVRDLRDRLGLDSGYLSRLLRTLEDDRLVEVSADPNDRRRRRARLTVRGAREWGHLDRRSEASAERLLAPLAPRQRDALLEALSSADRILRAASLSIAVVDPGSDQVSEALTAYFDELDRRFTDGFDPGDAVTEGRHEFRPPRGAFVLGSDDGRPAACGAIQRVDDRTAEIKRMWVHPDWRGYGVGRRMLAALESECRALGYRSVVLDTNGVLTEAIRMYESSGYRSIERYNDNPYAQRWFAKDLEPLAP